MSFQSSYALVSLGEVADFINGDRSTNYPKGDDYVDDGTPFISATELREGRIDYSRVSRITSTSFERLRSGKIQRDDVLFCLRGSIGKIAYVKDGEVGAIASSLVIVRATERIDSRYLFFWMSSQAGQQAAVGLNNGAAQPNLSVGELQKIPLPLPPLSVQRRIAGILSAYDELIENSQRRIKILETMARALYREWFVLFRYPGHENTPLVDSPLGRAPQGWAVTTFEHAAVFENGDRGKNYPSGSDFVDEGIPFINAGHLADGSVHLAQMNYISEEKFVQLRSGKIRKGDLLFCLRGSPGRTARTVGLYRAAIASSLVIIRPTGRANETFLYYTLVGDVGKRIATELNNGAAQPNVSVGSLQKYPLLLPPFALLTEFAGRIGPIWHQTVTLRDQLTNLRQTRDLLLPRLLSGELSVEDAA